MTDFVNSHVICLVFVFSWKQIAHGSVDFKDHEDDVKTIIPFGETVADPFCLAV